VIVKKGESTIAGSGRQLQCSEYDRRGEELNREQWRVMERINSGKVEKTVMEMVN
jgi:hypothetical protein